MASATIIILTFNSSRFITDLLKSLPQFAKDTEIIVVDNASTDDTVEKAKKIGNGIKVIQAPDNLGFAKGINFGAKKATGQYLLFINPDTTFQKGNIGDLINLFESERVGVVGGKLLNTHGGVEKSAGRFFNLLEVILITLGLDEAFGVRYSPKKQSRVDFVSGGFMMTRADLFKKLNGFDENFFMYLEDMEYCFRVKKEGKETYFSPSAVFIHAGQGSSNRRFAILQIYKGILYFYKKHKNPLEYQIIRLALFTKAMLVYLLGRITNNSYYISTYGKALELVK